MKNWFWWMWIKGMFSSPVTEPKKSVSVDRRMVDYYSERQQRAAINERETKKQLAEILSGVYKTNFEKATMFLLGHRPNPEYINLLAVGFPDLSTTEITELFYKISEEAEHVAQMYLASSSGEVVDVPTPVYDKVLADYNPSITFMGDIYPIDGTPPYLIKRHGVLTVMYIPGNLS